MKKHRQHKKRNLSNIVSAIVFVIFLIALVVYAMLYDPHAQYDNNFFNDVARSVQWH